MKYLSKLLALLFWFFSISLFAQEKIKLSTGEIFMTQQTPQEIESSISNYKKNSVVLVKFLNGRLGSTSEFAKYIGNHTYIMSGKAAQSISPDGIKSTKQLPPNLKYKKSILESNPSYFNFLSLNSSEKDFLSFPGIKKISEKKNLTFWKVDASESALRMLAENKAVIYIAKDAFQGHIMNDEVRAYQGAHSLGSTYQMPGLEGDGMYVGVGDGGKINDHTDIEHRALIFNEENLPYAYHAIHVSGIIGGNGYLNPNFRGIAPLVEFISEDFTDIIVNTPDHYDNFDMHYTNNSYSTTTTDFEGCDAFGEYTFLSMFIDDQDQDHEGLIHFFASGNSANFGSGCPEFPGNYGTILEGGQTAKNSITVGNVTKSPQNTIRSSSSRGPTLDGRIKPEVVAIGTAVKSTYTNDNYNNLTGTSMACPATTGSAVLISEKYKEMNSGSFPDSDVLRNIISNSASDRGNPGPDFIFGFGMVNVPNAVQIIENDQTIESSIQDGDQNNHSITIPSGAQSVKIMLHWSDPSAMPLSPKSLINDLNLSADDNGTQFLPLVPDPSNPGNNAVQSIDTINTYEQITILNPGTSISMTVDGSNIPEGPQDYTITYFVDMGDITLMAPADGMILSPSDNFHITWEGSNSAMTYTLEYSTDNGSSWNTINNSVSGDDKSYTWSVPSVITELANVRITDNAEPSRTHTNSGNFSILPDIQYSANSPCQGYIEVDITENPSAYESYNLLAGDGETWDSIDNVVSGPAYISGLTPGEEMFVTVEPVLDNNTFTKGRRATGTKLTVSSSTCSWPKDLIISSINAPANGRKATSTELTNAENIEIIIENIGQDPISNFDIIFEVDGINYTESYTGTIASGSQITYTSNNSFDLSQIQGYEIIATISQSADAPQNENNSLTVIRSHVDNPVLSITNDINSSYSEGFESLGEVSYTESEFSVPGATAYDYNAVNNQSRLRSYISGETTIEGSKTMSMDSRQSGQSAENILTGTYNLSSITTESVRLDFSARIHATNISGTNSLSIRGSDTDNYIQLLDLNNYNSNNGEIIAFNNINLTQILTDNGQNFTSSTQLKWAQSGNDIIISKGQNDGVSIDDIRLYKLSADVGIQSVSGIGQITCVENGKTDAEVIIENTASQDLSNINLFYSVNDGSPVSASQNISLNAGQSTQVTVQQIDLTGLSDIVLNFWLEQAQDQYSRNDSLKVESINTVPSVSEFPYHEKFENNDHGFITGGYRSSWSQGIPNGSVINSSVDGSQVFATNLNGTYNPNEESYLYSPCYDLSSMSQPTLSFLRFYDIEESYDYCFVQYSTDGKLWNELPGTVEISNYNLTGYTGTSTEWKQSSIRMTPGIFDNPEHVMFRWVMESDGGVETEGIAIDNIHIHESYDIFAGTNVQESKSVTGTGDWDHIMSAGNIIFSIRTNENLGNTQANLYFNPDPDVRHDNTQYYLDRSYVVSPQSEPTEDLDMRIYFTESEFEALMNAGTEFHFPENLEELGITQYSGSNEDGSLDNNDSEVYTFHQADESSIIPWFNGYALEFTVNGFSEFYINSGGEQGNDPLPIRWSSAEAQRNKKLNILTWNILSDVNLMRFNIMRKNELEDAYKLIHSQTVDSQNSGQLTSYSFNDSKIETRLSQYYYINAIHRDGEVVKSPVFSAHPGIKDKQILHYPNPVKDILFISTNQKLQKCSLFSPEGRLMKTKEFHNNSNQNKYSIDIEELPAGLYILKVYSLNSSKSMRIIKME